MTSTTANPQLGAFVRIPNSAPLPECPTQGFCQQPQLGAFANIPNSGLLSESPTRDVCQKYQPGTNDQLRRARAIRLSKTGGAQPGPRRPPSMGVQQRARAVEHPYSGAGGAQVVLHPFCSTEWPARAEVGHSSRVGTFGKRPGLGILTKGPSWGCWQKPRVGAVDKIPEWGTLAKAPSWGF